MSHGVIQVLRRRFTRTLAPGGSERTTSETIWASPPLALDSVLRQAPRAARARSGISDVGRRIRNLAWGAIPSPLCPPTRQRGPQGATRSAGGSRRRLLLPRRVVPVEALQHVGREVDGGVEEDDPSAVDLAHEIRVGRVQGGHPVHPLDQVEAALPGDGAAQPDDLRVDLEALPVARLEILRTDAGAVLRVEVG